jgi:leukotriene-A4 hydrolase
VIQYDLKSKHQVMGVALHVSMPKNLKSGTTVDVTVRLLYKTTKDCTALQWLDKEYRRFLIIFVLFTSSSQTQGKQFPYLFSQCQPIHARVLAPVQGKKEVIFQLSRC